MKKSFLIVAAFLLAFTVNAHAAAPSDPGAAGTDIRTLMKAITDYLQSLETADFIVGTATGDLSAERVCTDTATIDCDMGTAGQAKFNVIGAGVTGLNAANISSGTLPTARLDMTGTHAWTGPNSYTKLRLIPVTVATLPASPSDGQLAVVSDAASSSSCESGGGAVMLVCVFNATSGHWEPIGLGGASVGLQEVADVGRAVGNAVDPITSVKTGNGIVFLGDYCDSANRCHRVVVDANGNLIAADYVVGIDTNKNFILYDKESATAMWTIDPDAASPNAMYQIASGYRMRRSHWFDPQLMISDGTNCAAPAAERHNSGPRQWTFSCADDNGSTFEGSAQMPDSYDGGTVTFTLSLYHATTETITFAGDFAAMCRRSGDTINNTFGTAVAADVAITTAHNVAQATTAAVTPNGTCAGGAMLYWRYTVDAANFSANAANSKVIGVNMEYTVSSLSD